MKTDILAEILLLNQFPSLLPDLTGQRLDSFRSQLHQPEVSRLLLSLISRDVYYAPINFDNEPFWRLLVESLPDAEVRLYLHRVCISYSHEEDGLVTAYYHRKLFAENPTHPLLDQIIRRCAMSYWMGYRHYHGDSFGKDLSRDDFNMAEILAYDRPEYLPLVVTCKILPERVHLNIGHLVSYPHFDPSIYHLGPLDEGRQKVLLHTFISNDPLERFLEACSITGIFGNDAISLMKQREGTTPSPNVLATLLETAEDSNHVFHHNVLTLLRSKEFQGPVHARLKDIGFKSESNWWLIMQMECAQDPAVILPLVERLIANGERWASVQSLKRVCKAADRPPAEQAAPLLLKALDMGWKERQDWELCRIMASGYMDHPEARTRVMEILHQAGPDEWSVMLVWGELLDKPEFIHDALDHLREALFQEKFLGGSLQTRIIKCGHPGMPALLHEVISSERSGNRNKVWAVSALVEICVDESDLMQRLLEIAHSHPDESPARQAAIVLLRLHFGSVPEVRGALDQWVQPDGLAANSQLRAYLEKAASVPWEDGMDSWHGRLLQSLSRPQDGDQLRHQQSLVRTAAAVFGDRPETMWALLKQLPSRTGAVENTLDFSCEDYAYWQTCIQTVALRWPQRPEVFQALADLLDHPLLKLRIEASKLIARLYPDREETSRLLAARLDDNIVTFAEYMALKMGSPEAMQQGLSVLHRLVKKESQKDPSALQRVSWTRTQTELAQDGPLYLIRYFGPRKDLLEALEKLGRATDNLVLQEPIVILLKTFKGSSPSLGLDGVIPKARIEALRALPNEPSSLALLEKMAVDDASVEVRLAALEKLAEHWPGDEYPLKALTDIVQEGVPEALTLLAKLRPQSETWAEWLLDFKRGTPFSQPDRLVSETIANSFSMTEAGFAYLQERILQSEDNLELGAVARALKGMRAVAHPFRNRVKVLLSSIHCLLHRLLSEKKLEPGTASALYHLLHCCSSRRKKLAQVEKLLFENTYPLQREMGEAVVYSLTTELGLREKDVKSPIAPKVGSFLVRVYNHHPQWDCAYAAYRVLVLCLFHKLENGTEIKEIYPEYWQTVSTLPQQK